MRDANVGIYLRLRSCGLYFSYDTIKLLATFALQMPWRLGKKINIGNLVLESKSFEKSEINRNKALVAELVDLSALSADRQACLQTGRRAELKY